MNETIKVTERPELKTSEIMKLIKNKFNVWSYYDDEQLDKDFPAPKEATVAHFLDSAEPDSETLGLSVTEVSEKYPDKQGITLRQRLLLELAYFEKYGTHLDIKGVTFCSGSRDSGGDVPYVDWNSLDQKVRVDWYNLDGSSAKFGVRSAVLPSNLDTFSLELTDEQAIFHLKAKGYKITKEETITKEY